MTALAVTTVPAPRPLWHRFVSALVVVQAGVFWLSGAAFFSFCAGRWTKVYEQFEIKEGLPMPTKLLLHLHAMLSANWVATCACVGAIVVCLALLAALSPSRRAFRRAGWLTVACFFAWYGVLFFAVVSLWLPFLCITWFASGKT